jgi:serine protease
MAGTSQATPHVAGVIALMMAVNPKLTSAQVRSILIKTARPAPANCPGCGAGIVDAAAAVKAASGN